MNEQGFVAAFGYREAAMDVEHRVVASAVTTRDDSGSEAAFAQQADQGDDYRRLPGTADDQISDDDDWDANAMLARNPECINCAPDRSDNTEQRRQWPQRQRQSTSRLPVIL
jgi:hypothetical protein